MNELAIKLREIREVDEGRDTVVVNELLAQGWVLLKIRLVKEEGTENQLPIYILGLPFA